MLKLCWADRIGLVLLIGLSLALIFVGAIGPNPRAFSVHWWGDFLDILWIVGSKTVLPIWIFLRAVDLVAGGPSRRSGRMIVYPPR